jgi:predicted dehydrogenase
MNERHLKVGLIGAGGIARGHHAPGFRDSGRADLVAVCDIDLAAAQRLAKEYAIPHVFTDFEKMLAEVPLDAVAVTTSNDAHYPAAIAALTRKLHVYCEKPLALNYREAREMTEAARAAGVVTGINFVYRTMPGARYLKELLESGIVGEVRHFFIEYFQSYSVDPSRPLLWRFQKKYSGTGVLADLGSHATDLALWLAGPIAAVRGHLATFIHERPLLAGTGTGKVDVDDAATFLAQFANGAAGVIAATRFATGRSNFQRISIYGTTGAIIYENDRVPRIQVALPPFVKDSTYLEVPIPSRLSGGRLSHIPAFVNAILDGLEPTFPTFEDGLRTQEVLEAVERSCQPGDWVTLPLEG